MSTTASAPLLSTVSNAGPHAGGAHTADSGPVHLSLGAAVLQGTAIASMFLLLGSHALRLATAGAASGALPGAAWMAVGAVVVGYLFADFMSGCVHFFFDRFLHETTPVIGPMFVKPFRIHHTDPQDITRHGFLPTNGSNSLVTIAPLLALYAVPVTHAFGFFFVNVVVVAALATFGTNQFHKWAHTSAPPPFVRFVQRHGLVLSPEHHAIHHVWPHDTHYCITTGWMNGVLARVGFWRAAARVLALVFPTHSEPTSLSSRATE